MTNLPSSLSLSSAARIGTPTPPAASTAAKTQAGSAYAAAGQPPVPVKDRLESLLADQVKSGSLTDDQADELKSLFAEAAAPSPAPESAAAPTDGDSGRTGGLDTLSNKLDRMTALLDKMRSSMAQGAGYSAAAAAPAASAGMVFNGIA